MLGSFKMIPINNNSLYSSKALKSGLESWIMSNSLYFTCTFKLMVSLACCTCCYIQIFGYISETQSHRHLLINNYSPSNIGSIHLFFCLARQTSVAVEYVCCFFKSTTWRINAHAYNGISFFSVGVRRTQCARTHATENSNATEIRCRRGVVRHVYDKIWTLINFDLSY